MKATIRKMIQAANLTGILTQFLVDLLGGQGVGLDGLGPDLVGGQTEIGQGPGQVFLGSQAENLLERDVGQIIRQAEVGHGHTVFDGHGLQFRQFFRLVAPHLDGQQGENHHEGQQDNPLNADRQSAFPSHFHPPRK